MLILQYNELPQTLITLTDNPEIKTTFYNFCNAPSTFPHIRTAINFLTGPIFVSYLASFKLDGLRYLLFFISIALITSSCSSTRSTTRSAAVVLHNSSNNDAPQFLNNISIGAGETVAEATENGEALPHIPGMYKSAQSYMFPAFTIEQGGPLQFKYAIKMDVEVERLINRDLYKFIESWWGTPYRLGGSTQNGVDCSAFTQTLMSVIYGLQIPRTAREQKAQSTVINEDQLREGDLIFFNTRGRGVNHVGIYLQDNNFVHAASSTGVMISNLNEAYWKKRLLGAGRVVDDQTASAVSLHSR